MTTILIGVSASAFAGFVAGMLSERSGWQEYHNAKIERMAETTRQIVEQQAGQHKAKLDRLRAQLEDVAARCGMRIDPETGPVISKPEEATP